MLKNGTNKLFVCLAALTVFGNGAFIFNFSSENGVDFISSALVLIITAVTIFFAVKLGEFIKQKIDSTENFKNTWVLVLFLQGLLCLFFAVFSLADLAEICAGTVAEGLGIGIIILSLIITVFALVNSEKKTILKFSLIFFPICFGLVILIFLFSYPFMSLKYLELKTMPQLSGIIEQTFKKLVGTVVPVCLPLAVLCIGKPTYAAIGGTVGAAFLLLSVINTEAIFGSQFASSLSYPYAQAVSAVSLGELFSRMDAALYPAILFPGIVRISVQVLAAKRLFEKAKNIRKISNNY